MVYQMEKQGTAGSEPTSTTVEGLSVFLKVTLSFKSLIQDIAISGKFFALSKNSLFRKFYNRKPL